MGPNEIGSSHLEANTLVNFYFKECIIDELCNLLLGNLGQLFINFFSEGVAISLFSHPLVILADIHLLSALLVLLGDSNGLLVQLMAMSDKV